MIFLVVGIPHSGTTLLRRIFGSHKLFTEVCREQFPDISLSSEPGNFVYKVAVDTLEKCERLKLYKESCEIIWIHRNREEVIKSFTERFGCEIDDTSLYDEIYKELSNIKCAVSYNKLIENPQREVQRLCCEKNIEYDEQMLNYHNSKCEFTNLGEQLHIPNSKPSPKDHEEYRLWQINQRIGDI